MVKIVVAEKAGYCQNVRKVLGYLKDNPSQTYYCFGNVAHNPYAREEFRENRLNFLKEKSKRRLAGKRVIIPPHGILPSLEKRLSEAKCVLDFTCPNVKRMVDAGKWYQNHKGPLYFLGKKTHDETRIIKELIPRCKIISCYEEIEESDRHNPNAVVFVQTTAKPEEVYKIQRQSSLRVANRLCPHILEMQREAQRAAEESDLVFIIGSHESSNTQSLLDKCTKANKNSYMIGDHKDIDYSPFDKINPKSRIALCAGASTPDFVIDEVKKTIEEFLKARTQIHALISNKYSLQLGRALNLANGAGKGEVVNIADCFVSANPPRRKVANIARYFFE